MSLRPTRIYDMSPGVYPMRLLSWGSAIDPRLAHLRRVSYTLRMVRTSGEVVLVGVRLLDTEVLRVGETYNVRVGEREAYDGAKRPTVALESYFRACGEALSHTCSGVP